MCNQGSSYHCKSKRLNLTGSEMRRSRQDKRRLPRFTIMGMVRLQEGPWGKSKEAYIANISRGGIGLYSHKPVRPGETYCICPTSWDSPAKLWEVKAVWCKAAGDFFMAGFKFISMTYHDFDRFKKHFCLSFSLESRQPPGLLVDKTGIGSFKRSTKPTP
jgi:hypothetical protein